MQVDITVEEYTPGWYEYVLHVCYSPRHGVEQFELNRRERLSPFAVLYVVERQGAWDVLLAPSESIAKRFIRSNSFYYAKILSVALINP